MKYARVESYNPNRHNGVTDPLPWIRERFLYKVVEFYGDSFTIKDDDGELIYCLVNGCAHLGWGSWKIVEVNSR